MSSLISETLVEVLTEILNMSTGISLVEINLHQSSPYYSLLSYHALLLMQRRSLQRRSDLLCS